LYINNPDNGEKMTQLNLKNNLEHNLNMLAKACTLQELPGWFNKHLTVPSGWTGIKLFPDGRKELFTSGERLRISGLDRILGKGAGVWMGFIPSGNFNATFSMTNLLSGDNQLLEFSILCDVSVENEGKFFQEVVIPHKEISKGNLVIDLPELFFSLAALIRNYSAEDLTHGRLDEEIIRNVQTLLGITLPGKGLKLENVLFISLWKQEERLAIEEQLFILDQKMKDLEFEKKLAEIENEEEWKQLLSNNGIELNNQATILPSGNIGKNTDKVRNWIQGLKNDNQPGHNFRLKALLLKKDIDSVSPKKTPNIKYWWLPRATWMLFVIIAACGATFFLNRMSARITWAGRSEFYIAIWMFTLTVLIESVSKLYKQWEAFFVELEKTSNTLGLDNFKFKEKRLVDKVVREQSRMEFALQRDVLNGLRSRIYAMGDEGLAFELKRVERKIEDFIPRINDPNIGKPVYLREEINLSITSWNLLMDKEEMILIKAALLSEDAQELQSNANAPELIASKLAEYEINLDVFMSDFVARERLLHSENFK